MEPKIVSVTIGPFPKGLFEPMPEVTATFDNDTVKVLFWFFPDELSFTEQEFIGLTEGQARSLKYRKDVEYLRKP